MAVPSLSFEFFPPQSDAALTQLGAVAQKLQVSSPQFCSVTFGAGGSTQEATPRTVAALKSQLGMPVVPHISCMAASSDELSTLLDHYQSIGTTQLVVLRGDRPSGAGLWQTEWTYASELVAFIQKHYGNTFSLRVAAYPESHPEASSLLADVHALKLKQDAGANSALTQYFFNADSFYHYQALATQQGVTMPIIPGIMPIMDFEKLQRFSKRCEAEIPRWLVKQMESYASDPASQYQLGLDVVTHLCEQLLAMGVQHLHFYTLNQSQAVQTILQRLGVASRQSAGTVTLSEEG